MREDTRNAASQVDPEKSHETLKFYFTPVDPPRPDDEGETNPHAKSTTHVPDVVEALKEQFGEDVLDVEVYAGEHTLLLSKAVIVEAGRFLKSELGFVYLADLGGLDRFTEEDRYEVFYNLVNFKDRKRLRLKVRVDEDEMTVPSVVDVWRAANWNEREAYDMLGIRFEGHPDLRRMYMPEDFEYYPLRKEFPLLGIPGSLPLPPQTPEGELTMDPFAAAHGSKPIKSYEEPASSDSDEE